MSTVKEFTIKKKSGFFNNLTLSDFNGVRTLVIEDKEITMTDNEPTGTLVLTFNEKDEQNIEQITQLSQNILTMVGKEDNRLIEFTEWLFKTNSEGFNPSYLIYNNHMTIKESLQLWKDTIK